VQDALNISKEGKYNETKGEVNEIMQIKRVY